jgi:DNA-binding CsgD family transcriptional regulator
VTLVTVPVQAASSGLPARKSGALMFAFVPDQARQPPVEWLRSEFGLTAAESVLACLLVSGCTLANAADQLHVTLNTVKSQLKSIFSKTECHSQSALVRLMASGPAILACTVSETRRKLVGRP